MAKTVVETLEIKIPCPNCGKETAKTIAWVKSHDNLSCIGCGRAIAIEGKHRAAFEKIVKSEEELRRSFRKLGKPLR